MARYDAWHKSSYKHFTPMVLQPAGAASRFGSKERLIKWNAWIKGREHERSAFRHIGYRLSRILR